MSGLGSTAEQATQQLAQYSEEPVQPRQEAAPFGPFNLHRRQGLSLNRDRHHRPLALLVDKNTRIATVVVTYHHTLVRLQIDHAAWARPQRNVAAKLPGAGFHLHLTGPERAQ